MERVVLRNFSQNLQRKHLCVRVSFLKSIKKETFAQLFSCEFCKFFFTEQLLQSWRLLIATNGASFYCSFSPPSLARQLGIARQLPYTHCVCFTTQLFFMIAAAIFSVFYFLFLKLNLFPALHLCSVLPFLLGSFCRPSGFRLRC